MINIKRRKRTENIASIIAFIAIIIAWLIGYSDKKGELEPYFHILCPEASKFESNLNGTYSVYVDSVENPVAYISRGKAHGYGGELHLIACVDTGGNVIDFLIIDHKETATYFKKVNSSIIIKELKETNYKSVFSLKKEIDAVSGATYTSKAISHALGNALRTVAEDELSLEMRWEEKFNFKFGYKEALLIIIFILGFLFSTKAFPDKKYLKYLFFLFGIVTLGFYFKGLLTMTIINKFLLGIWPNVNTHFYGYLLVGSVLALILFSGKNIYCSQVCPFGSAQKCLSDVGGTYKKLPVKYTRSVKWIQRFLSLGIILWALLSFNPSIYSYEIFAPFFQLRGTTLQFGLLIIFLILSMFVKQPWCNYLCPVRPVLEYIRMLRNKVKKMIIN